MNRAIRRGLHALTSSASSATAVPAGFARALPVNTALNQTAATARPHARDLVMHLSPVHRLGLACFGMAAALMLVGANGAQAAEPPQSISRASSAAQVATASAKSDPQGTGSDAPQSLAPSPADNPKLETVQITATRVQRPGFVAPTPTTVLSARSLQMGGPPDIGASLAAQLPSY